MIDDDDDELSISIRAWNAAHPLHQESQEPQEPPNSLRVLTPEEHRAQWAAAAAAAPKRRPPLNDIFTPSGYATILQHCHLQPTPAAAAAGQRYPVRLMRREPLNFGPAPKATPRRADYARVYSLDPADAPPVPTTTAPSGLTVFLLDIIRPVYAFECEPVLRMAYNDERFAELAARPDYQALSGADRDYLFNTLQIGEGVRHQERTDHICRFAEPDSPKITHAARLAMQQMKRYIDGSSTRPPSRENGWRDQGGAICFAGGDGAGTPVRDCRFVLPTATPFIYRPDRDLDMSLHLSSAFISDLSAAYIGWVEKQRTIQNVDIRGSAVSATMLKTTEARTLSTVCNTIIINHLRRRRPFEDKPSAIWNSKYDNGATISPSSIKSYIDGGGSTSISRLNRVMADFTN